jgi:hypothetical protein
MSAPLLPAWDDAATFALLSENENSLLPDASDAISDIGDVVMEDGTVVDCNRDFLQSLLRRSPLKVFFRKQSWTSNDVQAAKEKDVTPVSNFVSRLCHLPSCVDPDNLRFCKCTCLKSLFPDMFPRIAAVLGNIIFFFSFLCTVKERHSTDIVERTYICCNRSAGRVSGVVPEAFPFRV